MFIKATQQNAFVRALALSALLVAAGCSTPTEATNAYAGLRIFAAVTDSAYGPGDVVKLSINNTGTQEFSMGLCPDALQRQSGASWKIVSTFHADCELLLLVVGPGTSRAQPNVSLPNALQAGQHRAVFRVTLNSGNRATTAMHYSEPFPVVSNR